MPKLSTLPIWKAGIFFALPLVAMLIFYFLDDPEGLSGGAMQLNVLIFLVAVSSTLVVCYQLRLGMEYLQQTQQKGIAFKINGAITLICLIVILYMTGISSWKYVFDLYEPALQNRALSPLQGTLKVGFYAFVVFYPFISLLIQPSIISSAIWKDQSRENRQQVKRTFHRPMVLFAVGIWISIGLVLVLFLVQDINGLSSLS